MQVEVSGPKSICMRSLHFRFAHADTHTHTCRDLITVLNMPSNWNSSRVRHSCNCRWTLPVARCCCCCCWPFLLALVKPRKCTRVNCHWPDFWPLYQKEANHGCRCYFCCCRILLPTILNTISWFITFVAGRFSSRPPAKCRTYTGAGPEWMHFRLRRVQKVGHILVCIYMYVCVLCICIYGHCHADADDYGS